jgi:hypothetical protein
MTSGSYLMAANYCQSAAWVRQSASEVLFRPRQATPPIIENETEVSFFDRNLYETFKSNPQVLPRSLTILWGFHIRRRLGGNVEFKQSFWGDIACYEWHVGV